MTFIELLLVALGLSMDAAAVSLTNGVAYCPLSPDKKLAIPLFFGLFQGLMPLLGYSPALFLPRLWTSTRALSVF